MTAMTNRAEMILLVIALVVAPRLASADEAQASDKKAEPAASIVELVVDPAPEPIPALRYHLLPPAEMRLPGNAAPIYLRLIHEQVEAWMERLAEEPQRFLAMSGDQLPLEEVRKFLDSYSDVSDQLAAAARRSDCDWQYVLEDRDPLMILLPDAQYMRTYGRFLAVRLRFEATTGDLAAAIGTLRDGLALSQHVSRAPFLVNRLVGIAISGILFEQADTLVAQPGAGNLYWSLAELPRPLVSLTGGLATEGRILEMKFPELADLDRPRAADDWQRLSGDLRAWGAKVVKMEMAPPAEDVLVKRTHQPASPAQLEAARAHLRDKLGIAADRVAAMSDAQVEVRYTVALYHETSDGWQKWYYLPYPQSLARIPPVNTELKAETERRELFPLVSIITPLGGNVLITQAKADRRVARLQLIEALRMHAAATGKLPEKLDDVTVVPVPLDPATAAPFSYKLEADAAVLDVADLVGMDRETLRLPVRIRLRGK